MFIFDVVCQNKQYQQLYLQETSVLLFFFYLEDETAVSPSTHMKLSAVACKEKQAGPKSNPHFLILLRLFLTSPISSASHVDLDFNLIFPLALHPEPHHS